VRRVREWRYDLKYALGVRLRMRWIVRGTNELLWRRLKKRRSVGEMRRLASSARGKKG